MIQIGGLCSGGNQVHLFHLFLLPHFAPKCRWEIKEKPLIMIDYQRFRYFTICSSDPLGARTQDPNIKSVVLYLLS